MDMKIEFSDQGPFDPDEREVVHGVVAAVRAAAGGGAGGEAERRLAEVRRAVQRLDRFGIVLSDYPSLFGTQARSGKLRDLSTLVETLSRANLSNFDMFLPTRALLSRNLVMGEVNFYRMLRHLCDDLLPAEEAARHKVRVDLCLCQALYTRLAEEVLTHIASDQAVVLAVRERAVLALAHIWEQVAYRVRDFFPVLQATWEARRTFRAPLGTLMGTREMFALLEAGCDPRFVGYLVRPEHTADEAAAFREFLFGATTEQLALVESHMTVAGKSCVTRDEVAQIGGLSSAGALGGDPALAMFEFYLARHLQAAARRVAGLRGPKRTAEEYVIFHYLRQIDDAKLSLPPK